MITFLSEEEIIEINRLALESQGESEEFSLLRRDDLLSAMNYIKKLPIEDYHTLALGYCISIIVLHPFKNGNHRTSLYSAERFLLRNGFSYKGDPYVHLDLQKWRIEYEEKYEIEREFFRITSIENDDQRTDEITEVMNSQYGKMIKEWLVKYYNLVSFGTVVSR